MSREYIAELVGTFALVFIGAGAVTTNAFTNGAVGIVGIALAHGLTLMAMIYAVGHISGTHINPAVTVAMAASRQIPVKKAAGYIVSQLIGAAIAGGALLVIFPSAPASLGATLLASGISPATGILIEAILTFFLVWTIFGAAVDKKGGAGPFVGIAIGLVLTLDILFGGALTGASMNPARSFGPALASGNFADFWVYIVGPVVGGLVAAGLYKLSFLRKKE